MIAFIRRHAVAILFVIVMVALFLTYRRQENLIASNRRLTEQVARQATHSDEALCASRIEARDNLARLLKSLISDFVPARPPLRAELNARIDEYLGPAPDGC